VPARPIVRSVLSCAIFAALAAPSGALEPTKASQIVSLNGFTASSPTCPGTEPANGILLVDRIGNANGSAADFAIPPKSVLVVTSVDYQIDTDPGTSVGLALLGVDPANPPTLTALGPYATSGTVTGASGTVRGNFVIPNGLVIEPPANLCFQPGTGVNAAVLVHGFIAKDK
jgi:hypothetical protein